MAASAALVVTSLGVLMWTVLAWLTGMGERHRTAGWPLTVAAALLFPVTWVVWYVVDAPPAGETARLRGGRGPA